MARRKRRSGKSRRHNRQQRIGVPVSAWTNAPNGQPVTVNGVTIIRIGNLIGYVDPAKTFDKTHTSPVVLPTERAG